MSENHNVCGESSVRGKEILKKCEMIVSSKIYVVRNKWTIYINLATLQIEGRSISKQNLNEYIGTLHLAPTIYFFYLVPIVKLDF